MNILEIKKDFKNSSDTTKLLLMKNLCLSHSKQDTHNILNKKMNIKYITNHLTIPQLKEYILKECDDILTLNLLKFKVDCKREINNKKREIDNEKPNL